MRRHLTSPLTLWLALATTGFVACQSFESGDPRVGVFEGSFFNCREVPAGVRLEITDSGLAYFKTSMDGFVESGSTPAQLSGGDLAIDFDYTNNSLGNLTRYSVSGKLLEGHQVVSGTLKYWSRNNGARNEKEGPPGCEFAVRRALNDPLYAPLVNRDFGCAMISAIAPINGNAVLRGGIPQKDPTDVPKASCFDGSTLSARLVPMASGRFRVRAFVGNFIGGTDPSRSLAVFDDCSGREIACVRGGELRDAGWVDAPPQPSTEMRMDRFADLLFVTEGSGDVLEFGYLGE